MREDRQRVRAVCPIAIHGADHSCSGVAAVDLALAAGRNPRRAERVVGLPLVLGVGAPACVGLVLVLRRPDTRVAWILLIGALSVAAVMGAFAVGSLGARREPAVRGRRVGARARDRVGRAVPVAARARLPVPRRAPAVAALAAPRGGWRSRRRPGRCCSSRCSRSWTVPTARCPTRSWAVSTSSSSRPCSGPAGSACCSRCSPVRWRCARATGREPRAPPPGPVARLRCGAAAAVARRDVARGPDLRRVRRHRTCSC